MGHRHKFRWWEGALFYAGVQCAALSARSLVHGIRARRDRRADGDLYRKQRLPWFAPPAVVFPLAWTINSMGAVNAGLRVVNMRRHRCGRAEFLQYQAVAWMLYAGFNTAYFELDSPLNGAAVTLAFAGVTAGSLRAAWRLHDRIAVVSLLPTAAWLGLACPLALYVAARNPDHFWGTKAFSEGWARSG